MCELLAETDTSWELRLPRTTLYRHSIVTKASEIKSFLTSFYTTYSGEIANGLCGLSIDITSYPSKVYSRWTIDI